MTTTAPNDLTYWRAALKGERPPIHDGQAHAGYYRMRARRDGPWLPVVIYDDKDGKRVARVGDTMRGAADIWTWCADKPVSKEAAMAAFATGVWPGDADEVATAPMSPTQAEPEPPRIGDNSSGLSIGEQIRDYAERALAWLRSTGIKDVRSKDTAANMRAQLLDLRKRADSEREAKKRPHLEASRAVDAEFKPLIEAADDAASQLRDALTVYMRNEEAKLRAEQVAREAAERERVAAERAKLEAERARQMRDDPIAAMTSPEPELPPMPEPEAPVKVQAGGQRGRVTGLRTVTKYRVTDYAAALAHLAEHPEVRAAVEKVAVAQARTGAAVPGVERFEDKVAA